jgi:peptidoglycan L-alanyl-D-glutamate endopeptidase CwlK
MSLFWIVSLTSFPTALEVAAQWRLASIAKHLASPRSWPLRPLMDVSSGTTTSTSSRCGQAHGRGRTGKEIGMAADLGKVEPTLKQKVLDLLGRCNQMGIEMRPNSGLRDPFEQARLWRQSRSREEINAKISKFEAAGASFLAHCLESVGPQHGGHVTDTPPGFSWHQWGEAIDCFWLVDGKAEWSVRKTINGKNGYKVYAAQAEVVGLTAGGHWSSFKDWPHVQLRPASNAGKVFNVREIDARMRERFE